MFSFILWKLIKEDEALTISIIKEIELGKEACIEIISTNDALLRCMKNVICSNLGDGHTLFWLKTILSNQTMCYLRMCV